MPGCSRMRRTHSRLAQVSATWIFYHATRRTSAQSLPELGDLFMDRPNLHDDAERKRGMTGEHRDGVVQRPEREHHDASKILPGFRQWTIGNSDLARNSPHGLGGPRALQSDSGQPFPSLDAHLIGGYARLHHCVEVLSRL